MAQAELYKHVNAVANEFAETERRSDYVKAAKDFRMPYWDWARPDLGVFPAEATSQARVQVKRPHNNQKDSRIDPNPLATYKFRESRTNTSINQVLLSLDQLHVCVMLIGALSSRGSEAPFATQTSPTTTE